MLDYGTAHYEDGYCYCCEHPPIEIRLKKNGRVIARSGPYSPKHKGYFNEALYRNVVEDITGTGVSTLSVSIWYWTGGSSEEDLETFYVYEDQPRATVGPNIDHYTKVCSLFTPLLCEIEEDILSKNINGSDYLEYSDEGTEENSDDTLLGLPANLRSGYQKKPEQI